MAIGRTQRQDLPPRLPGGRQPVDKPVRLGPQPATRERGDVELHPARPPSIVHRWVFTRCAAADTLPGMSTRTTGAATRSDAPDPTLQPPRRIVIQYPAPQVDDGRYPVKRCVGDRVTVQADVFRDGHDLLRAVVSYIGPDDDIWHEAELHRIDAHLAGVRWEGSFVVDRSGRWEYTIQAWTDVFGTWRDELERKVAAGQHELAGELSEGIVLLRSAAEQADSDADRRLIEHAWRELDDPEVPASAKHDVALGEELHRAVERGARRLDVVTLDESRVIEVDRLRARFGAWYEMFPRSW